MAANRKWKKRRPNVGCNLLHDRDMTRQTARRPNAAAALDAIRARIVDCEKCPRLRAYCREVARVKRAAYRDEEYWGRPVPGMGDPMARVLILGLAPAAHGGDRKSVV